MTKEREKKKKNKEDRLCIGICAAGKKSEKFLKHKITFVLSLQYLNSNGANFESALEVKNETEINLKKCAFDVGQNEEKNNQHKNEKYETNDTLRIEKVFHWKWVWSDLILSNVLDGQPRFIKTRPKIQILTFCSGMFLIFVWCEHLLRTL